MTIRVTISNDDSPNQTRTVRVIQNDVGDDGKPFMARGVTDIAPGKSEQFHVWDNRELCVREFQITQIVDPPRPGGEL